MRSAWPNGMHNGVGMTQWNITIMSTCWHVLVEFMKSQSHTHFVSLYMASMLSVKVVQCPLVIPRVVGAGVLAYCGCMWCSCVGGGSLCLWARLGGERENGRVLDHFISCTKILIPLFVYHVYSGVHVAILLSLVGYMAIESLTT